MFDRKYQEIGEKNIAILLMKGCMVKNQYGIQSRKLNYQHSLAITVFVNNRYMALKEAIKLMSKFIIAARYHWGIGLQGCFGT